MLSLPSTAAAAEARKRTRTAAAAAAAVRLNLGIITDEVFVCFRFEVGGGSDSELSRLGTCQKLRTFLKHFPLASINRDKITLESGITFAASSKILKP